MGFGKMIPIIYLAIVLFGMQKVEKYKQLLTTDEYSTNQFHSFEQYCNTFNLDGALNIIESVHKRVARETGMTKIEAEFHLEVYTSF